jgi:hypothetical protein
MSHATFILAILMVSTRAQAAVELPKPARVALSRQVQSGEQQLELWRQRRLILKKIELPFSHQQERPVATKAIPEAKPKPVR